jgi:hypothetical protein
MPASWWAFLFVENALFGLKKFFGSKVGSAPTLSDEQSATPVAAAAFICREAIFDRKNRLSGHIFFLQHESPLANAPTDEQQKLDTMLCFPAARPGIPSGLLCRSVLPRCGMLRSTGYRRPI